MYIEGNSQEGAQGNSLVYCSLEWHTSPEKTRRYAPRRLADGIEK